MSAHDPVHLADEPVVLVTRPGCHLCDIVRPVLVGETAAAGVAWTEVCLSERPDLEARFGELVPVTLIDGFIHDYWRLDRERLRAALAALT